MHPAYHCLGWAGWLYVSVSKHERQSSYSLFRSLVVNIIAGEVTQPIRRTVLFGKLQGCIMLGQGIGYLSK